MVFVSIVFENACKYLPGSVKDFRLSKKARIEYDEEAKKSILFYKDVKVSIPDKFAHVAELVIESLKTKVGKASHRERRLTLEEFSPYVLTRDVWQTLFAEHLESVELVYVFPPVYTVGTLETCEIFAALWSLRHVNKA